MNDVSTIKPEQVQNGASIQSSARPAQSDTAILDSLSRVLLGDAKQSFDLPRALQSESKRLQAITKIVNSFHNYIATVAGRPADEMTASDVARLGMVLKIVEEIELTDRTRRLS
ncbi:hypothetical protein GCM10007036_21330 [Alsobacter metallidurans]|uniref:Uncharacterized protein n=1 Tax=Alsobacter metallidurans TaxID=340221 RepID=A0A917MH72_9HYPH|nr:hypothetical protein [Alsobacter metallidurans]GGH18873.1 hypothetical protein GCM10007036_21330 [Alsobacter metallidurans]